MSDKDYYLDLVDKVKEYDDAYYNKGESLVPNSMYDELFSEIETMEAETSFIADNSPTQKVGSDSSKGFKKVSHKFPMLSINDVFERDSTEFSERYKDILAWINKMIPLCTDKFRDNQLDNGYTQASVKISLEPKFDGCAVSLIYENGKLLQAVTRGDGSKGDDITANALMIDDIPKEIHSTENISVEGIINIRGEIFMKEDIFEELNKEREIEGLQLFANPRNTTAGTIKQLDPEVVKARKLSFLPYDLKGCYYTSVDYWHFLANNNMITIDRESPYWYIAHDEDINEIEHYMKHIKGWGIKNKIPCDGVVLKVCNLDDREKIGYSAHAPKWAAAFKFLPEQVTATIKNIAVQVGRTGVLTPVAEFDPVAISGSMVARATLHNQDEIDSMNVNIGDEVIVEKAGEIIPYIRKVVKKNSEGPFNIMFDCGYECPRCGGNLARDGAATICTNDDCVEKIIRNVMYFGSRKNFNIQGMGPEVAIALVETGIIKPKTWYADIFNDSIKWDELLVGNGILGKTGIVIKEQLNQLHDTMPLHNWISAMGIPTIGTRKSKVLASKFANLEDLIMNFKTRDIVNGLGPASTEHVITFFEKHWRMFSDIIAIHGDVTEHISHQEQTLEGKVFCLTGKLYKDRKAIADDITARGGKVNTAISKNVNYLACGESSGSKRTKAEKLGIEIIDSETLQLMIEQ